ncbi:uncharacterized protein KGF55_003705 [Candida pseudojiufengensis]|uniref:uncharacterized protein n=1 Tax=Candida pseudojiufengensis TaxID=497109 RepID=UPI002224506C|nr:uncharacterized protein KGF55_003705 [Candida pseudojiufengensis]KAI5962629.1 hypothetical protein KGF55_003705 [Candida pseudojiufengensis]
MSDPSARIISHMNKDHQLSLNDYVIIYGSVNPKYLVEDSVQIVKIDTNQIIIEYDVIKPPATRTLALYWTDAKENDNLKVESWSDIKGKLISMANYCAEKQGYASKKITKILGPNFLDFIIMYPTWIILILNSYNPSILRNLFVNDQWFNKIIKYLPQFVFSGYKFSEVHALKLIYTLTFLHLGEIIFITIPLLKKYRAPNNVKLAYYILNFIEGFPVLLRLKKLAK